MESQLDAKDKAPLICLPCHYTCATCSGPHNSQCLSCLDDAQLYNGTDVELKLYCYPKTVVPQITNAEWHYKINVALAIVSVAFSAIILYILISCSVKRYGVCNKTNYNSNIKVAYNKLASDEKQQSALEIEEEIQKAIKYSSDSESDDELHL
ncbi:unnamed protein product [Parnassius mnemosyne]